MIKSYFFYKIRNLIAYSLFKYRKLLYYMRIKLRKSIANKIYLNIEVNMFVYFAGENELETNT